MTMLHLYKITLRYLWPNDDRNDVIFWGYHMDEAKAREAALIWGAKETGDAAQVTIKQVDLIK